MTWWWALRIAQADPAEVDRAEVDRAEVDRAEVVDAPTPAIDVDRFDVPVVGGAPAPAGKWPDAVALYTVADLFGCSGVLIAPDLVLTAGHCGYGIEKVVVGATDHRQNGETVAVVESFVHPDYFTTFDVALMVLERDVATVPPRRLALDCIAEEGLRDDAEVAIVGFGATDEWATEWTTVLQEAFTTVRDADCSDLSIGCNDDVSPGGELVAGGDGVDSCTGDSGGPLYLLTEEGDFLVGITSRAALPAPAPCGSGGIYVRADAVVDWIETTTGRVLERPECEGHNRAPEPSAPVLHTRPGGAAAIQIDPGDPDPTDGHTFELLRAPEHGRAWLDADGRLLYQPPTGFAGAETALVLVRDDGVPSYSAELEVMLDVTPTERTGGCDATGGSGIGVGFGLVLLVRRRASSPDRRRPPLGVSGGPA